MDKKPEIIKAATQLFARQGFNGTTTLQIANKIKVTEPLIHHHFKNKHGLFISVLELIYKDVSAYLNVFKKDSETEFENVRNFIEQCFLYVKKKPDAFHLINSDCPAKLKDPEKVCVKCIQAIHDQGTDFLTKCFEKGIKKEEFREIPVEETAIAVYAMLTSVLRRNAYAPVWQQNNMKNVVVDFCRNSLLNKAEETVALKYRIENELYEKEEKYQILVENMSDGLGVRDENEIITFVNDALCNMLGFTPAEFMGRKISDFINPESKQQFDEQMAKRKAGDGGSYELEFITKDNRKVFTIVSPKALYNTKGEFKGSFAVITDITTRKRSEEGLKRAKGKLEREVRERTADLEESNEALKVLLKYRERDKYNLEKNIIFHLNELVLPYVEKLKGSDLGLRNNTVLSIMESNLKDVLIPATHKKASVTLYNLTYAEIKVANLIKQGRSTKQIAEVLNLSKKTVELHRHKIRKKIGITNRRLNLRTKLMSVHIDGE